MRTYQVSAASNGATAGGRGQRWSRTGGCVDGVSEVLKTSSPFASDGEVERPGAVGGAGGGAGGGSVV